MSKIMSANNYIEIHKEGKEYVILDLCIDTDRGIELHRLKELKAAIEWAETYSQDGMVEYGIRFGAI